MVDQGRRRLDLLGVITVTLLLLGSTTAAAQSEGAAAPSLTMGQGRDLTLGGWVEVGRADTARDDGGYFGELYHLAAAGDRLVAIGSVNGPNEGPWHDVVFGSSDAIDWEPALVPGTDPQFTALAAGTGGLVLAGSDVVDSSRSARLWSSPDGVNWTELGAPPVRGINQIVSANDPIVVVGGNRLWSSADGSEWTMSTRMPGMSILRGPGGYLMWQAGGQEASGATVMLFSQDLSEWHEMAVPKGVPGKGAFSGFEVFALADRWLLVPSEVKLPDTIFMSSDGETWQQVPRPPGMQEGSVDWIASVADTTQAFGTAVLGDIAPSVLWTWSPGDAAGDPATLDASLSLLIGEPVAWQGGYEAVGYELGPTSSLDVWRLEPPAVD